MKNQDTLYSGKHEMQKSHLFDFLHQFNKTSKSVTYGCSSNSILLKPRRFRVKNTSILTEKKHFTIFTLPIIDLVYYPSPKFCIHCTCIVTMIVSNWVLLIEDNGYAKCWMGGSAVYKLYYGGNVTKLFIL